MLEKNSGIISYIERGAIHDGPGIRTVVFMKGCDLFCKWCSNPESQNSNPEILFYSNRCEGCLRCVEKCEKFAITKEFKEPPQINFKKCDLCGLCIESCLHYALEFVGNHMTVDQVLDEVKKDVKFYENSGGGVTLSGGDPLFQAGFTFSILKECKKIGIHTALETSGYLKWDIFTEILDHVDLLLLDIKHLDPVKHEKLTGVSNTLILENTKRIVQKGLPIILRFPLIPGCNNELQNLIALANFALNNDIKEIDILPYHKMGVVKYERLGRMYHLADLEPPSEEQIYQIKSFLKDNGIKNVKIEK